MSRLVVIGGTTYQHNGVLVGRVEAWSEAVLDGSPTVHQVAKRVGGLIRHALPSNNNGAALCGARPTGGWGTRGTWRFFGDRDLFGVTCKRCARLEPTPAAISNLHDVIERCID